MKLCKIMSENQINLFCLQVKALGTDVGPSMVALPQVLRFLARCVIQDAADGLALLYPEQAVHQLLLSSETFV